jgi:hypothetical protein
VRAGRPTAAPDQRVSRIADLPQRAGSGARAVPLLRVEGGPVHVGVHPIYAESGPQADLVLLHDMSFLENRKQDTRQYLIVLIGTLGASIALVTVVVAQLSWRGWVSGARALLRGEGLLQSTQTQNPELAPIAADLRARLRELDDEYRRAQGRRPNGVRDACVRCCAPICAETRSSWCPIASHTFTKRNLPGISVKRPAGGVVTAIEPVMRACSGTWIAHGSGSADAQVVDAHDHLLAPPGHQEYTLRRIWLTEEEEQGYYYGFANEGLWPLCHVAHVRPIFRENDWAAYREVNRRFAEAVVAEARSRTR